MRIYRGKHYEDDVIRSAAGNMFFLVWPKIIDDRCYGDEKLAGTLVGNGGSDDYAQHVAQMRDSVTGMIRRLTARKVRGVRLGASWAEYDSPGGRAWIMWYIREFSKAGFDILPCLNYTPVRFAEARIDAMRQNASNGDGFEPMPDLKPLTNVPPYPIEAFAGYVGDFLADNADHVGDWIELWNEPNLDTDWNMDEYDPDGKLFVEMIAPAAVSVRAAGKKTLLGGLTKFNESIRWLEKTCDHGLLDHIDALGLHGLRGTWSDTSVLPPWKDRMRQFKDLMSSYSDAEIPIWITEAGFTTVDLDRTMDQAELERIQAAIFADLMLVVADGDAERVYWYSERDQIIESVRFLTTGWEDPLQWYFGDTDTEDNPKLLRELLEKGGPLAVLEHIEARNLWALADTVIQRGNPGACTKEKRELLVNEMDARAKNRRAATEAYEEAA